MTLDELKGSGNVIDTTAGKVEAKPVTGVDYASADDPHFSTNDGVRGTFTDSSGEFNGRTPVVNSLEEVRPIRQVQSAPIDLNELSNFDLSSLPKKPPAPNELEDILMNDLEAAVNREMDSITERMDAVTEMQRKEMLDQLEKQDAVNNMSIPTNMDNYAGTDYTPETVVTFEKDDEEFKADPGPSYEPSVIEETVMTDPPQYEQYDPIIFTPGTSVEVEDETDKSDLSGFFEEDPGKTMEDIIEEDTEESSDMTFNLLDQIQDDIDSEFPDDDSVETTQMSDEEIVKKLQSEVKSSMGHVKKKFDLSKFSVASVPMAASKVVGFSIRDMNKADWVLPNSQSAISVTGLSGPELISMDPENSTRNKINTQKDIYSIIYRHIDDPNKGTFEHWMKTTRFSDIQHIYFALYKATFSGSNFIHYECPKCNNIFIKDMDFDSLVHYKDEETEKRIKAIINGHTKSNKPYTVTRFQVSDKYVVDIKEPSLWNTVIEITSLSDAFVDKYEDVIDLMSFINAIYVIDEENCMLIPIDPNPVANNISRTVINKISAYADIIRKIPSDNFFELRAKIASTFEGNNTDIVYRTPACKCPKCNADIPEQKREGSELLFMRHQLGALGVM